MKYLKKYNESKITTLDSLSDDELRERLKWLVIEREEILEEIGNINKLLVSRKEDKESKYSESLPESIFDFNKEQLDWLFEHHHGTTQKHYNIAQKYIKQLHGVHQYGFNPDTDQFAFSIVSTSCFNDDESSFEDNPFILNNDVVKSIKFLGNNLKKNNEGCVEFKIMYYFDEGERSDKLKYFSDDNLFYAIGYRLGRGNKFTSIEKVLEDIVDNDLSERENRDRNNW